MCLILVAEQVSRKYNLEIQGIPLTVKMLRPCRPLPAPDGPLEDNKIFVCNISTSCETSKLKCFFSKSAGCQAKKIEYAPRVGEAMIVFEATPSMLLHNFSIHKRNIIGYKIKLV